MSTLKTGKLNSHVFSIPLLIGLLLVSLFVIVNVSATETETYSFITKWGEYGSDEGQFNYPSDITVDNNGYVYVVDAGNNRVQKFSNDGTFILQWGTKGSEGGQFNSPSGIAVDNLGNVYVADIGNHRTQKFSSEGVFLTKFDSYGSDIAVDKEGNVYVPGYDNTRIQKFNSEGIWLASWNDSYKPDRYQFMSIAVDNAGYVYVLDNSVGTGTGTVQRFDSNGVIQNTWYTGEYEYPGESPTSLTVDNEGFVYVVGYGAGMQYSGLESSSAHIVTGVNKYTNSGKIVTRWGNSGTFESWYSSSDGEFAYPRDVAVDNLGNVFVADTYNHRIQKFAKVPDPSVRGNWFFDENQGEIVYDNSFYRNNGLIFGASWINGVSGSALNFDGIDDYVYVSDSDSLRPQQFTVKAWVKLKSGGTNHFDSTPLTKGWEILACSFTNSFMPQAFFGLKFIGDETWTTLTTSETFALDRWLPVVYTYDGYFMKIYVNGEEKASLAKIGTIDWSDDTLFFGANNWGGYDYSIIDEVKIYDKPYPYPAERIVTEIIRPWWQISLTDDGLSNTQQIYEGVTDYDRSYISALNSKDYSFILGNLTYRPVYQGYPNTYPIIDVRVNVVAETIGLESNSINLEIETWGEKHTSPTFMILANQNYRTYSYTWNYNPATNEGWTKGEVDDLHAGFSVNVNGEVRVTRLYVEVKYNLPEPVNNLISNGGFSSNYTNQWKNYSLPWNLVISDPNKEGYSGTVTTTSDAYEGNYGGLFTVTNRPSSNTGYIIIRTGISSYSTGIGKMFKLEFYYKGTMTVYPNVYSFNLVYDSGTGYLAEKKLLEIFSGPECLATTSWTYVSMTFGPIPTGTKSTEIHFDVASTGEFYFDNVNVTKITTIDYRIP